MGKKSAPKAPDLTPQANASVEIARINQQTAADQLAWAKEQDANNRALLERVVGVQLPIMEQTFAQAQRDRQRYEEVFVPMEDRLIAEADSFDSPQRQATERGRAIADVNSAFDAERRNAAARLESFGIDPSQTRAAALDVGVRTAQAAAAAGAATTAGNRVEDMGRAMRADVVNLGRGLPSQVAQSYGQSAATGQGALGGALNTSSTGAALRTSNQGAINASLSGYGQGANIMSQGYQNQLAGFNASQNARNSWMDPFGTAVGFAAGAYEDGGVVSEQGALPVSPIPGSTDRKPALLTPGEFVVPDEVVRFKGEEFFHKLISKSREMKQAIEAPPAAIPMGA